MKKRLSFYNLLPIIVFLFPGIEIMAQIPDALWGDAYGNYRYIAPHTDGSIYSAGWFYGTQDFDPGPGVVEYMSYGYDNGGAVEPDIFLTKEDSDGNLLWAKRIGSTGPDMVLAIAVDIAGNVYITGRFGFIVDFDPGPGILNLNANNGRAFIAKYAPDGSLIWVKQFSSTGSGQIIILEMTLDVSGNICMTGQLNGTMDFDLGAGNSNTSANGTFNGFVLKMDGSGTFI